jgi:hypothetical protein
VHHGAEGGRVDPGSGGGRCHTLGQQKRWPDLQALGGTWKFAGRLEDVQRLAADQDRPVLGVPCRDNDVLHLVAGDRRSKAADEHRGGERSNGQSDRCHTERTVANWESATLRASVHASLRSHLNQRRANSTDEVEDWIPPAAPHGPAGPCRPIPPVARAVLPANATETEGQIRDAPWNEALLSGCGR